MQDTNLKISPYFDDFDSSKNYQKVLFKPGYSVQTRELNTLQSILQNQVERFGQHVFKDGSLVIPGNVNYNLTLKCVLIQPLVNGISVETYRESLVGRTLTGASSGVKAKVVETLSQEQSEKDTITLYITYNSGGIFEDGAQVNQFKNNETLVDESGNAVAITTVQNASSYEGSTANINAGVYFIRGFFVEVLPQRIILEQYSSKPSYKVGLQVNESIATVEEDETLYDNSLGSTNYASPGADRLKIDLKLVKQNLLVTENADFVELLRFEDGIITQSAAAYSSIYNELEKNLARRTFDESGSYTTKPYTIKVREALNDGENGGVYLPNEVLYDGRTIVNEIPAGNSETEYILGKDYYAIELSEGKAYVEGFEVINERKQYAVVPKPRKYKSLNNQGVILDIGSHLKLDANETIKGTVRFNDKIFLKDVDGNIIGRAKAIGLSAGFNLYLADVTVYEKLTIIGTTNVVAGDFITGNISGATAFIESVSGNDIFLRQVNGYFIENETITPSRYTANNLPKITAISRELLENVRTVEKIVNGSVEFAGTIKLDEISISGSSFEVSNNTELTGTNTAFNFELSEKSRIRLPGFSDTVEVDSVSSSQVDISSNTTIPNGTYYSISKLICKLYSAKGGLTVKSSSDPTKSSNDYLHNRLISDTGYTINSSGGFTIQTSVDSVIDKDTIIITTDSARVNATFTQTSQNTVVVSNTGLSAGTSVTVYYKVRISNPSLKTKEKQSYKFLVVDKVKNASNNVYGTRISDREISLKYPDVLKIHGIHQATRADDDIDKLFDYLKLNDTSQLKNGDLIALGTIKARVISIDGTKVYIKYVSKSKFQSGTNLAISINVPTNSSAVGLFIRESSYGRYIDITNDFKFVRNDDENFYKISKLVRKSSVAEPQNKFVVIFDYFEHDNFSNDFYTIQSYYSDIDSGRLNYEEIPLAYNYAPMSDIIDFRYYVKPSLASGTGTISSPLRESSTSSPFDMYEANFEPNQKVPYPSSIFGLDYEFYLGRIDKVYLTTSNDKYSAFSGQLRVLQGADSIEPLVSNEDSSGLLLATVTLPPYLKKISDARIKKEKTRNYTMRDIGKLEDRLSNVEKYTSLSLLEVNTNNLNILDEEGRNRFKNGFVVDSFTSNDVADTSNSDYTASLDLDKNIVRPYPYVNNTGLYFSENESTARKNDSYVTLPYTEVVYAEQPYSSRVENILPYEVFSWVGNMEVTPKKDIWYDTQREIVEGQNINLVDSYTALFDLVVPGGQIWGDWELGAGGTDRVSGGREITDIIRGTQYEVGSLNFDIESGDTIQSVTDIRYSRSRIVNIGTTGLKPNTNFYFYVNDSESSDIIYPKLLKNLTNNTGTFLIGEEVNITPIFDDNLSRLQVFNPLVATIINPTVLTSEISIGDFDSSGYTPSTSILAIDQIRSFDGSDINPPQIGVKFLITGVTSGATARVTTKQNLLSNEFGTLNAFVLIPQETFETGDLTFSLSDQTDNYQIQGLTSSYATGMYYSQGTEISVTSNITTLEVPELTATTIQEERVRFIPDPPPPPRPRIDPIAQSFFVDEQGGIFVTSIDLFFLTKDSEVPVILDIRTVENGNPTSTVVPGSTVSVTASDVRTSLDAAVPTRFQFKNPVYLSNNSDYAFVVRSTANTYNLWVSRLGETDVTTGLKIDKQPYIGVLYKSSNQSIWTPDQFEDIKFVLNRAQFTTNQSFTAVLPNKPIIDQKLINNPLKFTNGSSTIKVFQPNHGMHQSQNRVKISNVFSDTSNAQLASNIAADAQTISLYDVTGANFNPSSVEGWSTINNSAITESNPGFIKINDEIISYTQIFNNELRGCVRGVFSTTASSHSKSDVVQCFQLNGIPLNQINTTHVVSKAISLDEYEIVVTYSANSNKQTGGPEVLSSRNIQYESITPKFNIFTPNQTNTSISMTSISGTSIGNTAQRSFLTRPAESIENGVENILNEPKLVLSQPNINAFQSGVSGTLNTIISMTSESDRLSPVIDLEGSSIITISNRLNKEVDTNGILDLSSELTPSGGKHSAYITKKVVLETSSTSVKVLFDAIRNPSNEIKVFVKIKGDSTPGSFDDMNYIEIPAISYPTSVTKKEFRAFDYEIKSLKEFKEFSVKIVMIGNDQSSVPKIRNFRALALAL